MKKNNGLFIGLTTVDIQYFVENFPKSNVKIKTDPPEIYAGGPVTNAAIAFSFLNKGNTFLASATGVNSFSEMIQNELDVANIKHFDIAELQNINPVLATIVTSLENGERNIFTHNPGFIQTATSPNELFKKTKPEIILLDGFYPEFGVPCAKLAKQNNIPVVLDCGSWKPQYDELLGFADTVICSRDFYPPDCFNSEQVIKFLQSKKIENIAVSRGEKSILFSKEKSRGEINIKKTNVIDTLGAGDFLHGAFCHYFAKTSNFENALQNASEFATFTCQFKGTRNWLNFTK